MSAGPAGSQDLGRVGCSDPERKFNYAGDNNNGVLTDRYPIRNLRLKLLPMKGKVPEASPSHHET